MAAAMLCLLVACVGASGQPSSLSELFRTEVQLAATKLRVKAADLDADVALALAATGVTWEPMAGGHALIARERKRLQYAPYAERLAGYRAATAGRDTRVTFSFALSIVLDCPDDEQATWRSAYSFVSSYGRDFDRVLLGVLGAHDRMPLLPRLTYAAADLIVMRCDTEYLPLYLALASSGDSYLRSRGVAGISLLSCSESAAAQGPMDQLHVPVRAFPISAAQRVKLWDILERAARDRSYRVRGAAALGLGLSGHERGRELLQRLARDPAYVVTPGSTAGVKRIHFPVRATAEDMLARLGFPVRRSGGEFTARTAREATRGGKDVTRDRSGMRRDVFSPVRFQEWGW